MTWELHPSKPIGIICFSESACGFDAIMINIVRGGSTCAQTVRPKLVRQTAKRSSTIHCIALLVESSNQWQVPPRTPSNPLALCKRSCTNLPEPKHVNRRPAACFVHALTLMGLPLVMNRIFRMFGNTVELPYQFGLNGNSLGILLACHMVWNNNSKVKPGPSLSQVKGVYRYIDLLVCGSGYPDQADKTTPIYVGMLSCVGTPETLYCRGRQHKT